MEENIVNCLANSDDQRNVSAANEFATNTTNATNSLFEFFPKSLIKDELHRTSKFGVQTASQCELPMFKNRNFIAVLITK